MTGSRSCEAGAGATGDVDPGVLNNRISDRVALSDTRLDALISLPPILSPAGMIVRFASFKRHVRRLSWTRWATSGQRARRH